MSRYPDVTKYPFMAIDTETDGLHWWKDNRPFCLQVGAPDAKVEYDPLEKILKLHECWYLDLKNPDDLSWARENIKKIGKPVGHNIKFDVHMLRVMGVEVCQDDIHDTMIRAALINEHEFEYGLDHLCKKYTNAKKYGDVYAQLAEIFGGRPTRNGQIGNLHRAPLGIIKPYAMFDIPATIELFKWQEDKINEPDKYGHSLQQVYRLEQDLLPVLIDIEAEGVRVDVDEAERAGAEVGRRVIAGQAQLNKLAGYDVNVNPSNSLKKLIAPVCRNGKWFAKDGTPLEATDAGNPSIGADALRTMKMPEAKMVLALRKLRKTKETFIEGHILGHQHNNLVHASFNQTKNDAGAGTGTGRLSVNGPALQQIPKRDKELAAIVRAIFIPDLGQQWCTHDWEQMDFRIFAEYAQTPSILKAYADDDWTDFHQIVADLTGLPRSADGSGGGNAKQVNLGLVFGMGKGKLAQEMGLPYSPASFKDKRGKEHHYLKAGPEAEAVFQQYHANVPGVDALMKRATSVAKSRQYVRTVLGRKIRFPGGNYTHKAAGLIFQGSAADCLKQKLVEVWRFLKNTDGRLLLNVHDEFDTSIAPNDRKTIDGITEIIQCFDGVNCPIKFGVPIRSEAGVGPNWWEASK